jgi:hypothetical protein
MKKLYRSALFAGLMAFGVAACGDDVTIVEPEPTPPAPLQVTLTPSNASVTGFNQIVVFAVGVSGGAEGAQASWTCSSSNTTVATVAATAVGCAATSRAAGSASITATVTKGNQSANAGAQLTVVAPPAPPVVNPATVSIATITQGGLTQPVDISDVAGQIDVSLNVNPNDQRVTRVEVLVDGTVAASQEIAAAAPGEEDASEALQVITLSFNTGAYTVTPTSATPRYLNGARQIRARVFVAGVTGQAAASNVITLQFNNTDGFHVLSSFVGNSVINAAGLRWIGGPSFNLTVSALPVLFSGQTLNTFGVTVGGCGAKNWTAATSTTLALEYTCAGIEEAGVVPSITSQYTGGAVGPTSILNLTATQDHPFPARIDVKAPTGVTLKIVQDTIIKNAANWVNASYNFATGRSGTLADAGVGVGTTAQQAAARRYAVSTDTTVATAIAGPAATLTGAALAETLTNTAYRAWVFEFDLLGNQLSVISAADVANTANPLATFGVDKSAPEFEILSTTGAFDSTDIETFVQAGSNLGGLNVRATDIRSGFPQTAATHGAVRAVGSAAGTTTRTRIAGSATATVVADPFAAANAGTRVLTGGGASPFVDIAGLSYITQSAVTFTASPGVGSALLGYYIYQWEVRDNAGNIARAHRKVYVNGSNPVVTAVPFHAAFTPDNTFQAFRIADDVEFGEGSMALAYPATGGTVVYERPGSALSSALRAGLSTSIGDDVLFNNVIRTQTDGVNFSTGGVFFRAIIGVDANGVPAATAASNGFTNAKPTRADVQVFNGFAIQNEDTGHGAVTAGASAVVNRSITGGDVTAGYNFATNQPVSPATTASWTFTIVDSNAADCNADYCIRAEQTGAASAQFADPFDGNPVFVAWAATGANPAWRVFAAATPNFQAGLPTRSSGTSRVYEWTFDLTGLETGGVSNLELAAIGTRGSGTSLSGLVTTYDGTVTPPPPPAVPAIQGTAATYNSSSNATSHNVGLPTGMVAGEVLMMVVGTDATLGAVPSGWFVVPQPTAAAQAAVYCTVVGAVAPGNPSVAVTSSGRLAAVTYRLSGATVGADCRDAFSVNNVTGSDNPPALTLSGGASGLWFAAITVKSNTTFTVAPTGFSGLTLDGPSQVKLATAHQAPASAVTSLDPSAFTPAVTSGDRVAFTIAVR